MTRTPFENEQVKRVFDAFSRQQRTPLLKIREWIFQQASRSSRIGRIEETLKWGEPSYLTPESRSGSTIRLGVYDDEHIALYFNCQTSLVEDFRTRYGHMLAFAKNRAVVIKSETPLPEAEIRACIDSALLYHVNRKSKVGS